MVLNKPEITEDKPEIHDIRKKTKISIICPICKEKQRVGVEIGYLKTVKDFPFAHINIHGDPVHALIVFFDAHFTVRGIEGCDSIEINNDSVTFIQLLKKWSNPF